MSNRRTCAVGVCSSPAHCAEIGDCFSRRHHRFEAKRAEQLLDSMTEEQRLEVMRLYCRGCGAKDRNCTCTRDD